MSDTTPSSWGALDIAVVTPDVPGADTIQQIIWDVMGPAERALRAAWPSYMRVRGQAGRRPAWARQVTLQVSGWTGRVIRGSGPVRLDVPITTIHAQLQWCFTGRGINPWYPAEEPPILVGHYDTLARAVLPTVRPIIRHHIPTAPRLHVAVWDAASAWSPEQGGGVVANLRPQGKESSHGIKK